MTKRSGMAGIQFVTPPYGPGALVSSLQPEGAGVAAGLHVGDRVLSVQGRLCSQGGQHAMDLARDAGPIVRLVVTGVSSAVPIRKDADGRLGLQFVEATPSRAVVGAVVASLKSSQAISSRLKSSQVV